MPDLFARTLPACPNGDRVSRNPATAEFVARAMRDGKGLLSQDGPKRTHMARIDA